MTLASVVLFLLLIAVGSAQAGQAAARSNGLPAGVQQAVQRERAAGATIKHVGAEKEHGATVYEIETVVKGHTRDLLVDEAGSVIEVEEEVAIDAVPPPVKAALEAVGKVLSLETVTRGTTVTYEAQIQKNGKRSEVAVDASGNRVKP